MKAIQVYKVNIILSQRDFFRKRRRVIRGKNLILRRNIGYLDLADVLEILEYDVKRRNPQTILVTDGSEFVTIPRRGSRARREEPHFGSILLSPVEDKPMLAYAPSLGCLMSA